MLDTYVPRKRDIVRIGNSETLWEVTYVSGSYVSLTRHNPPVSTSNRGMNTTVSPDRLIPISRPKPLAPKIPSGVMRIIDERSSQISRGYTPAHDAQHVDENGLSKLTIAAMAYITATIYRANAEHTDPIDAGTCHWPFDPARFHPSTTEQDLAKAGAFLAAEIDRRQAAK